jgi:hypothetical protein
MILTAQFLTSAGVMARRASRRWPGPPPPGRWLGHAAQPEPLAAVTVTGALARARASGRHARSADHRFGRASLPLSTLVGDRVRSRVHAMHGDLSRAGPRAVPARYRNGQACRVTMEIFGHEHDASAQDHPLDHLFRGDHVLARNTAPGASRPWPGPVGPGRPRDLASS